MKTLSKVIALVLLSSTLQVQAKHSPKSCKLLLEDGQQMLEFTLWQLNKLHEGTYKDHEHYKDDIEYDIHQTVLKALNVAAAEKVKEIVESQNDNGCDNQMTLNIIRDSKLIRDLKGE